MAARTIPRWFVTTSYGALLLAGVFAACGSMRPRSELDDRLEDVISDRGRRAQIAALIGRRDTAQDAFWELRDDFTRRLRPDSATAIPAADAFDGMLAEFDAAWEAYRDEVIETALAMHELTTDTEWQELAEDDLTALLADPRVGR